MKSANVIGPRARMRSTSRSRRVTRAVSRRSLVLRVPTRRTRRPDLLRPDPVARGLVGGRAEVVLVVVEVDRLGAVELVLGEAMLEREPLEVAPPHIRAHALEAARGLLLGGGLVVALLDELEALHAVGEREERHADLRLLGL